MLNHSLTRLERWLFSSERIPWLAQPLRCLYAIVHDLVRGELTLRAMGLVYTTLMSIVPLLALLFSVFKSLKMHRQLEPVLFQFLEPLGDKAYELTARIMQFIDNIQSGVLGTVGLAFLLYTSVSMIQKLEESFNFVWRVEEARGFGRRVREYLSALVLGPFLLAAAFGLLGYLANTRTIKTLSNIKVIDYLLTCIDTITPYVLICCVFTFLYAFVPNTKVRLRAALVAGIAAGVIWSISGLVFASFVGHASGTMLVYAGFAAVILGLIWVHLSWLILLLGAQLAFYVQYPQCLRPGSTLLKLSPSLMERLALSVMHLIARSYAKENKSPASWTANALAERLNVAGAALDPMLRRLEATGLLVATEKEALIPGRDIAIITLADILEAVRSEDNTHKVTHIRSVSAADAVVNTLTHAVRASLQGRTLKDWIEAEPEAIRNSTNELSVG
jgi:membrane protein